MPKKERNLAKRITTIQPKIESCMLKSHRLDFWNVEDLSEQTTVQAKMILKKKKNN